MKVARTWKGDLPFRFNKSASILQKKLKRVNNNRMWIVEVDDIYLYKLTRSKAQICEILSFSF